MTEPSPGTRRPSTPRLSLLVLYSPQVEACRRFYGDLGLRLIAEKHGEGPEHYAAVLGDAAGETAGGMAGGTVFELYPARPDRQTDVLRLGLTIDGSMAKPPLSAGRYVLIDPDGRTVEIHVV